MRILALDLATKTGWATDSPEEFSGVEDFSLRRGESPGMRYLRLLSWLDEIADMVKPSMICYEQAHHRGGAATEVAAGLATHLQSWCARNGIEHASVHSSKIKKHATGKGNAGKPEMMDAYRRKWGCEPTDDNECDARWILDWARAQY